MVFDADFVPIPEALKYTVPYIVSDPKIGILQTPQYFDQTDEKHKNNEIEFGGGNIVEEFYNLDQVSRDRFDAAICVGTSAIYRREAIMSVGGTPKVNGTEDVRTGLSITQTGYKVRYIPLIISIGTSPNTLQDYFRQHNRWCKGSIKILFDYYIKAKISLMGKLIYLMNPIYYISEALVPILLFHFVILFAFHTESLSIYNSLYFVPKLLYEIFFMPVVMRNHKTKRGTKIAAMNNIFAYFYTIFVDMPTRKGVAWHPAGVGIQGVSDDFRKVVRIGVGFSTIYVIVVLISLIYRREYLFNIQSSITLLWLLYSTVWYMLYILEATKFLKQHDIQYQHPNPYLTQIRHIWAHIKHLIVPTTVLILFVSTLGSMYMVFSSGNYKLSPITNISSNTPVTTIDTVYEREVPDISTEIVNEKPSEYTFTAEVGDGVTHLARKAIESYTTENELTLSAEQKVFMETTLKNIYYQQSLDIGENVSFETSVIADTVSQANNLTPDQIQAWSAYVY